MRRGRSWAALSLRDAGPSSRWISAVASVIRPARTRQVASCISSSRPGLILRPWRAVTADRGGDSAKRSTEKRSTYYPFLTGVSACGQPYAASRDAICRSHRGKFQPKCCNAIKRTARKTVLFVEFCGMSEQSNGMRAAEAKRTELVALGSHCRPAGNLSWTNHRARMRENEACPVTGGQHCRLGRNYPPSSCSNICCAAAISFPLGDPTAIPQCYFFVI
jgi:hypothetical protein